MKKFVYSSFILLSVATLTACSSSPSDNTTSSSSSTEQTSKATDNSQYDSIVAEIKTALDPNNTGEVTVEVENDIIDSEYPNGHNIIKVLLTGETQKSAKEALDAVYSNTATTEQNNAITLLRMTISELAKKLPDDTTVINFGYEVSADQYDLIAKSSKTQDIIPVGELIVE